MEKFYTAQEAIKHLNIPRSTFFYLVKTGQIPKVVLPLRKQAIYPRETIDKFAEEQQKALQEYTEKPERLVFTLPTLEDLRQLVDLDRIVFEEETLILPEQQQQRFRYNPEAMHVLKDSESGTVLGGITMSRIRENVLDKLIKLEIDETQIIPEDYLPFEEGQKEPINIYVVGIIVKPGPACHYVGEQLLKDGLHYLSSLLERGITIGKIYTVATTEDGDQIARKLGFMRLPGEWKGAHEDFRHPYVLDLFHNQTSSLLVKQYQRKYEARERRIRRYRNQAKSQQ